MGPLLQALRLVERTVVTLKVAVILLGTIGAFAIYGTVALDEDASMAFFTAWPFSILMIVLMVALAIAVISRYPWKKTQIGWIMTHAGLITVILGHMIKAHWGEEGRLSLWEPDVADADAGAPGRSSVYEQEEWVLTATLDAGDDRVKATVPVPLKTLATDAPLARAFRLPSGDTVAVERYYPSFAWDEVVTNDDRAGKGGAEPDNPAIRVEVRSVLAAGGRSGRTWLFARSRQRSAASFGGRGYHFHGDGHDHGSGLDGGSHGDALTVYHVEVESEAALRGLLEADSAAAAAPPGGPGGKGVLTFAARDGEGTRIAEVAVGSAKVGEEQPIGSTGYAVKLLGYFPDLRVGAEGTANSSDEARNPAVALEIRGPDGRSHRRMLFAFAPELDIAPTGADAVPFDVRYDFPMGQSLPTGAVMVSEVGGRTEPVAVVKDPFGERRVEAFRTDRPIPVEWLGAEVHILDRFPRARLERVPWNADYLGRVPAVLVSIGPDERAGGAGSASPGEAFAATVASDPAAAGRNGRARAWVRWNLVDRPEVLSTERSGRVELTFGPLKKSLGFEVELRDFILRTYEGTENPSSFESDVIVRDLETGHTFPHKIYMNHPLTYKGYTFYQADYDKASLKRSTFQVSYDPSWRVVYLGYILTSLGVAFIFFVKPIMLRRAAKARAEAVDADDAPEGAAATGGTA